MERANGSESFYQKCPYLRRISPREGSTAFMPFVSVEHARGNGSCHEAFGEGYSWETGHHSIPKAPAGGHQKDKPGYVQETSGEFLSDISWLICRCSAIFLVVLFLIFLYPCNIKFWLLILDVGSKSVWRAVDFWIKLRYASYWVFAMDYARGIKSSCTTGFPPTLV